MSHVTACPHCHKSVKCDEKHVGLNVNCPACHGEFVVPPPGTIEAVATTRTPLDKSGKWGSPTLDAAVGHTGFALAVLVGVGATIAWFGADISQTPGLYLCAAILCGVVVMAELVRRELVRIRLSIEAKHVDDRP